MASSFLRAGTFSGKSAVVTGGGTGIGYAIARELVSLGGAVVLAGRREPMLAEAAAALKAEAADA